MSAQMYKLRELHKPTKKMLKMATSMCNQGGVLLTIEMCSKEQLQLLLAEALIDLEKIDKRLQKAHQMIEDCLP